METQEVAVQETKESQTDIVTVPIPTETMPDCADLEKLSEMKKQLSITVQYRKKEDWVKGEAIKAYYLGLKEIPDGTGELIASAIFQSQEGAFMSAATQLVETVRSIVVKTPIEITFTGSKTNKSDSQKSTMIFQIDIIG